MKPTAERQQGASFDLHRDKLTCAAMAPASGGMSKPQWWEAAREGGLRRRRMSAQPTARASPGGKGPLGCRESPLI
jgi:hypothetical protein